MSLERYLSVTDLDIDVSVQETEQSDLFHASKYLLEWISTAMHIASV